MTARTRAALACLSALAALHGTNVLAHDTWLSPPRTPAPVGEAAFELSTGNRYPVQESGSPLDSLAQPGCVDGAGRKLSFRADEVNPGYMLLRTKRPQPELPLSCWAELKAWSFEMPLHLVPVYLAEIKASKALRDTWAGLNERKLPWRETFTKYARIEAQETSPATPAQRLAARKPAGLPLELVIVSEGPVATGQELVFQLLRDGQPLAGLPLELISERSAIGIWRETDAEGKVRHTLPFTGRWLLRGTDLRISQQDATRWESRFATLALDAAR